MSIFNEGRSSWTDYYPVQEQIGKGARLDPRLVLFVDVGGGLEQEGLALRKRYPDLPGRFMIQDLPQIVSGQKADGVQFMAHDIFAVQPVKGRYCDNHPCNALICGICSQLWKHNLIFILAQGLVFTIYVTSCVAGMMNYAIRSFNISETP